MSQCEKRKESMLEINSATTNRSHPSEKPLEHRRINGLDKSESNLRVKATMARELSSMGLEIEAIGRILRTEASRVEEWISSSHFKEESR